MVGEGVRCGFVCGVLRNDGWCDEGVEGVGEDVGDETTKGVGGWRREDVVGEGEIVIGDEVWC